MNKNLKNIVTDMQNLEQKIKDITDSAEVSDQGDALLDILVLVLTVIFTVGLVSIMFYQLHKSNICSSKYAHCQNNNNGQENIEMEVAR